MACYVYFPYQSLTILLKNETIRGVRIGLLMSLYCIQGQYLVSVFVIVFIAIQKAQLIVDAPCNEMHTDAFIEVRIM